MLTKAVDNPYAAPASRSCKGLNRELGALNAALGEDFTASKEANEDRTGKIAEAIGKTIVNSLIPFRGLVREISGAAPAAPSPLSPGYSAAECAADPTEDGLGCETPSPVCP